MSATPGPFSLLRFTAAPALYCLPEWWPEALSKYLPTPPGTPGAMVLETCSATLLRRARLDGSCEDALHGAARAALLSTPDFERLTTMLGVLRRQDIMMRRVDAASIRAVQAALGSTPLRRLLMEMPGLHQPVTEGTQAQPGHSLVTWLHAEGVRVLGEAATNWCRDVRVRTALRVPRLLAQEWRRPDREQAEMATAAVLACLDMMESPRWL